MANLEERLARLEDMEAIRELLLDYGKALDSRDTEAYSQLFSADGEWSGGIGQAKTPAGIKKMLDDVFGKGSLGFAIVEPRHIMGNMRIKVDGDTGTALSQWVWLVGNSEGSPRIMRSGRYEDELVRENGQWKFRKRRAVTELSANFEEAGQ